MQSTAQSAYRIGMLAGAAVGMACCGPALAQVGIARADDFEQCRRAETMVELRLKSCTNVIGDTSRLGEIRAEAYLNRGNAHEELGRPADAIEDYTQGLKLNPEYRALYHRRGLAYDREGKTDLAIADFSEAIRLDPKDTEALVYRGLSHAALGDHVKAIPDFDAALAEDPDDAAVLTIRGESREAIGDRDRAIGDFRRALELDPDREEAEVGLARLGAKGK
ncbi:MAG: tetratricopeptide repeat protein [Hyphomicrobiaceae bacterium]|nr:tetratricopeptide repeat protein [Hyphomicrobiaceae bacterium]